jgi:hypothetical protein
MTLQAGRGPASTDSSLSLGFSILNRIAMHPSRGTILMAPGLDSDPWLGKMSHKPRHHPKAQSKSHENKKQSWAKTQEI